MLFSLQQRHTSLLAYIAHISDEVSAHENNDWQCEPVPSLMEAGMQRAGFSQCIQWITVLTFNLFCCSGSWPRLSRDCQACWTVPGWDMMGEKIQWVWQWTLSTADYWWLRKSYREKSWSNPTWQASRRSSPMMSKQRLVLRAIVYPCSLFTSVCLGSAAASSWGSHFEVPPRGFCLNRKQILEKMLLERERRPRHISTHSFCFHCRASA